MKPRAKPDGDHFLAGGGEMGALMRSHDWSRSPLGAPSQWPDALKMAVSICLNSRFPMVLWWGPEFIMLYNDAWRPVLGETKHPGGLGRPGRESWPEIWNIIGAQLASVLETGQATWSNDLLLVLERNKYREEAYFTYSYSPIKSADGRVGGVFSAVSETTERVLSERRLRILRQLSTQATEATTQGRSVAATCEAFAGALGENHPDIPFAALYLTAEPGAKLMATTGIEPGLLPDLVKPGDADPWCIARVLHENQTTVLNDLSRLPGSLPGGAWPEPTTQVVVLPLAKSGQGAGATGVLVAGVNPRRALDKDYRDFFELVAGQLATNVTNARAYEEERRRAEMLAELDRAKTTFFSNVSHEFRTPLTLMLGPLEDLLAGRSDELGAEHRAMVDLAHRNGLRLLKLVNALLDFSRIEAGRAMASFEPVDLSSFTAELASSFRSAVDRAGLRLAVDCRPLPQPVYVDRDMWEKIVLNLLSNAFKFTFEGEIGVRVAPAVSGNAVAMEVRDTGTGIPAHELPHLFERFRRVEGAKGRSIEGSGIGLALVQELVKLHGGTVSVASEVGRGATFTVTIPFGKAHLPADRIGAGKERFETGVRASAYVEEALGWLSGAAPGEMPPVSGTEDLVPPTAHAGQNSLVLLADDNADMRHYVERLLRSAGYRVDAVADGESALARARQTKPDLVLADVMMPHLDGFGLLEQLRKDRQLRQLPIILLSARAGEEAKVEGLRAGADDYLIKPFSARELVARVETNLKLARSRGLAAEVLREEAEILRLLNRVGAAISAEVDLERVVKVVIDAAREMTGAKFGAFFYNVMNEEGGAYMLYMLSGAPKEAFAQFPMPRKTAVFGPTFGGEGIVRSDDITQDPRYGKNAPYHGMPKGHLPVRSYLAAPVVARTGDVLGGLFFGHPDPEVFDERAERVLGTIAVQAAIALEKARLYSAAQQEIQRRSEIEAALRESERDLERRVAERTAELAATNQKLVAEAAERERAESRLQLFLEGVSDYAIYMLDTDGRIANWNTGAQRIKGYTAGEIVGRHFGEFYLPEDRDAGLPEKALSIASETGKFEAEGWRVRKDGSRFWASAVINAIHDRSGKLIGFAKITRDITERRQANEALQRTQEQLAQAQKMEGIGQLTGGVAHDFNNLLTVIMGNLETLQRGLNTEGRPNSRLARSLDNAMRGAQRATALTQRLLAFSRRQPLDPKPVDIGKLVSSMSDLLRRTIGEQIAVETVLAGGLWRAFVDPNQLEVAIVNLAVNARDAMPNGGKLTLETANAYLDEAYAATQAEVVPGQYVVLCITDTGTGMTPEIISRAFEPFFTTKEVGQGTGLGLSQVYGFVKQSGGHVRLYSEVGEGTTVKLYLPRLLSHDQDAPLPEEQKVIPRSSEAETILVVEDDMDVREYTKEMLSELGYVTLVAATGNEALRILDTHQEIELLFTDVGLPGGMNGRQLADEARRRRPGLKVLFTTGYARNAIVHDGRLDPGVQLLTKPFTYSALATKLSEMLATQGTGKRVLLVEDEILVQMIAIDFLQQLGYRVEAARTAVDALNKFKLLPGRIEAAIIDIGLPDRKGDDLARELLALQPNLPIVIASGYGEQALKAKLGETARVAVVAKPYTRDNLQAALQTLEIASHPGQAPD